MKQLTAIEHLYQTLWKKYDFLIPRNVYEEAKEMERRQIVTTITKNLPIETGVITKVQKAQEYYNKTYNKEI